MTWGIFKGVQRAARAAPRVQPGQENNLDGGEIEDAVWEEIQDDDGKSP